MIGTITKKIQPDVMGIQWKNNTVYEAVGCAGVGVGCPELDNESLDPITNLPIYKEYSKQRHMLNDSTEM